MELHLDWNSKDSSASKAAGFLHIGGFHVTYNAMAIEWYLVQ